MASTIRTYKAALSTYHEEHSSAVNPLKSDRISRLIAGIENAKAETEAKKRRDHPKTEGVTMDMIRALVNKFSRSHDRHVMLLGAAALATAAALRPSEVLGSARSNRALKVDQVRFYATAGSTRPITAFIPLEGDAQPDHVSVTLRVSKTNQRHADEQVQVAAPAAVRALWAWRMRRHSPDQDSLHGDEFFRLPGYPPPAVSRVLGFVKTGLVAVGFGKLQLTGKCFRIGGTSSLAALGAPEQDICALGRWKSPRMWRTYADPSSHKARAVESSRRM